MEDLTDPLTGARNRKFLEETFSTKFNNSHNKIFIALSDFDRFKCFNDTFGRDLGDGVLRLFVEILEEKVEKLNVFRIGGDEFFWILDNVSDLEAEKINNSISETFKERLENYAMSYSNINNGESFSMTVTVVFMEVKDSQPDLQFYWKELDERLLKLKKYQKYGQF